MKKNTITNKDCLKYLKTIPDNSIDLVLTDPPYFIGFDGGKGWDKQWKTDREYNQWCISWTKECIRVLKDERMLVVWGTLKTEAFILYKLALNRIEGIYPQNEIIWSYNWGGRSKDNFARKHEYAWCYSTGKKFLFNGDDVRVDRKVTKNLDILQRIIRAYTNENDTVLDIFMGSGSTAIASKLTNRDYIGCELDIDYLTKARKRIKSYDRINTLSQFL